MRWPASQMRPSPAEKWSRRRRSASEGKGGGGGAGISQFIEILQVTSLRPIVLRVHQIINCGSAACHEIGMM
ncbi:MAG TPA: hypothetical protein VGP22_05505, partial [Albitalea sp.]|nr:hypothetical protein [Albitalea sp.]